MGHVPKYGKGKQKTNRKEHSQTAPPESPDKSLCTRHGSRFSGTAIKSGARTVEMRTPPRAPLHTTCARNGEIPNHGERQLMRKQRRCRCAPKVRPYERLCNTYRHNEGKWLCRLFRGYGDTYFHWRDGDSPHGRSVPITAAHLSTTIRTFTLRKQCRTT